LNIGKYYQNIVALREVTANRIKWSGARKRHKRHNNFHHGSDDWLN
jgi:hypothetical protein